MSDQFKQAAEKAADEVIDQIENDNFDPEYVQFIIAKHFAPLAEQYALLVESFRLDNKESMITHQDINRIREIRTLITPLLKGEK